VNRSEPREVRAAFKVMRRAVRYSAWERAPADGAVSYRTQ
jgi:hypothetical protein